MCETALASPNKIDSGAVFFDLPDDPRFYGAAIFDPPTAATSEAATHGRIVGRKKIVDTSGAPVPHKSLRGLCSPYPARTGTR